MRPMKSPRLARPLTILLGMLVLAQVNPLHPSNQTPDRFVAPGEVNNYARSVRILGGLGVSSSWP